MMRRPSLRLIAIGLALYGSMLVCGNHPFVARLLAFSASDSFTYSNGNLSAASANWTDGTTDKFQVSSNAATTTATAADHVAYYTGGSFTNDQYSQAVLNSNGAGAFNYPGVTVRCTGSTTTLNCYGVFASGGGSGDGSFFKIVNGTRSTLAGISGEFIRGHTIKLTISGSSTVTLTAYDNGASVGSTTDSSSPIASGSPGLFGFPANAPTADDWQGGDGSGITASTPRGLLLGVYP